jgi:dTDP-glucose 4,6-dehydratase
MEALGFAPDRNFDPLLEQTVKWFVENEAWWRKIKSDEKYTSFTKKWYDDRK